MAKKKAARKAHSEVRWVMKYRNEYGKSYFGGMLTDSPMALPSNTRGIRVRRKVRVTEILPAKRKAKR